MCGITAILTAGAEIPSGAIERMTRALRHRGPDAQTWQVFPGCHLGNARLSIIDLACGVQPMTDPSGRYTLVFNGEIYNYRELRADLKTRGIQFRTESDTEVLLQAFCEFGERTPEKLNGQFAFAVWDQVERRLFVARDRFGEKPLYWAQAGDYVVISSELKSLLKADLITPKIDPRAVDAYSALLYVPPDRTIYENVQTLAPGEAMVYSAGEVRSWRYWRPRYSWRDTMDEVEAIRETYRLVRAAVQRQMVADVPVGAWLSGGLDSATIVALMSGFATSRVKTFAVGFGDLINELPYAREVAHKYGTEHHEMQMDIPVGELLETMADIYDEPLADSSNIPTYLLAQYTSQHVKVALSGDGGDEIFGGYHWYGPLLAADRLSMGSAQLLLWRMLASGAQRAANLGIVSSWTSYRVGNRYALARMRADVPDAWDRHLRVSTDIRAKSLTRVDLSAGARTQYVECYRPNGDICGIDRGCDFDVRCYLPGDILTKVDRASMANSLEIRAPFLDVELAEFVLSLPYRLRFKGRELKYVLRRACQDLWPASVRARDKQGFGAPISTWLTRPDVQALWRRVTAADSPLAPFFPHGAPDAQQLTVQRQWSLVCLGLWLEKHTACMTGLQ